MSEVQVVKVKDAQHMKLDIRAKSRGREPGQSVIGYWEEGNVRSRQGKC